MGRHLAKSHLRYVHVLDARVMGKTLHIAGHAPRPNKTMWSMVPFAQDVLKITSASGATKIATILPMRTLSGATCVWKSGANALAAMASLHHMDLLFVINFVCMPQGKVPMRFVNFVGNRGNVRCANLKSVPKFDGLPVKMFA